MTASLSVHSTATDGPELIERAVSLRPDDAEYHTVAAIAYFGADKTLYKKHWDRAHALAKPGSAAARNLPKSEIEQTAAAH